MLSPLRARKVIVEWWHVIGLTMALLLELWRDGVRPLLIEILRLWTSVRS